jgi:hypothetical protein
VTDEIRKGLIEQSIVEADADIESIDELVFDYAPVELKLNREGVEAGRLAEPLPPRQYFLPAAPPNEYPPLPRVGEVKDTAYRNAFVKDPDLGFPFGVSIGLLVNDGTRLIRAMSFCRRRRNKAIVGHGRMLRIRFRAPRAPQPFSIGAQCHFGMGMFRPENSSASVPKASRI